MNKELTLEQAKDLKAKLDCAWKQVHEFTKGLEKGGYEVKFKSSMLFPSPSRVQGDPEYAEVIVKKTETITL